MKALDCYEQNIPGLEVLERADLAVFFLRWASRTDTSTWAETAKDPRATVKTSGNRFPLQGRDPTRDIV